MLRPLIFSALALGAVAPPALAADPAPYAGVNLHVTNAGSLALPHLRFYVFACDQYSKVVELATGQAADVHIAKCVTEGANAVNVIVEAYIITKNDTREFNGSRSCVPKGDRGGPAEVAIVLGEARGNSIAVRCE